MAKKERPEIDPIEPTEETTAAPEPGVAAEPAASPVLTLPLDQLRDLLGLGGGATSRSPELDKAASAIQALADQQAKFADQQARTVGKSNAIGDDTGLSAFTFDPECAICRAGGDHKTDAAGNEILHRRKAHPKPALAFRAFFCGAPLAHDQLTPLEVSLLNSFQGPKDARGGYGRDGEDGGWSARFTGQGSSRRLEIWLPHRTSDVRNNLPSLPQILTELLYGQDAVDQIGQIALIQKLQQQLADQGKQIDALTQATAR